MGVLVAPLPEDRTLPGQARSWKGENEMSWIGLRARIADGKKPPFVQVDVHLRQVLHLFRARRNSDAFVVFICLALHTDKNGWCFPSRKLLMRETGLSKDGVTTALRQLREMRIEGEPVLGVYRRQKRGKFGGNVYWLFPAGQPVPPKGLDGLRLCAPEPPAEAMRTVSGKGALLQASEPCPVKADIIKEIHTEEETEQVHSTESIETAGSYQPESPPPPNFAYGEFRGHAVDTPTPGAGAPNRSTHREQRGGPGSGTSTHAGSSSHSDELERKLLGALQLDRLSTAQAQLVAKVCARRAAGELTDDWIDNCLGWHKTKPEIPAINCLKWILNDKARTEWLKGDTFTRRPHAVDSSWD
jgi:hypothetical protein